MQTVVNRKGLYVIFIILVFLFTGFSIAADKNNKHYISPEDYYTSHSFNWMRLYYDVDFADLYDSKIEQLKAAYDNLSSDEDYYEIHFQYLEIPSFPGKDTFLYGYEEGHADNAKSQYSGILVSNVKAIQLSKNCLSRFNLSLWKGEFYLSDDYYDGDLIPIVLGYEYRGIYDVGDEIEGAFIAKPFRFRVVGILNKDSHIMTTGTPLYLDRYILMPSVNCLYSPTSQDEDLFQVRHYVNKLEGWFEYSNKSDLKIFNNKIAEINKILPGKIESYLISNSQNVATIFAGIITIKNIVRWVSIFFAIAISIFSPLLYFRLQVKSKSLLCVNIMSGINYTYIVLKSILLFIFVLLLSNICTMAILLLIKVKFPIIILVIDFFAITMVVLLNSLFLKETKLISSMGGADFAPNTKHF